MERQLDYIGELQLNKNNVLVELAGEEGFEPSLDGPEPSVLPLDDSPATDVTESKSRPLAGLLNTILPLNLPQKTTEIRQLIQSQLPNSPICDLSLAPLLLKYQAKQLWSKNNPPCHFVIIGTDNANETISIVAPAPPTPREPFIPARSADETRPHATPLTLPEYVTEVALC